MGCYSIHIGQNRILLKATRGVRDEAIFIIPNEETLGNKTTMFFFYLFVIT